MAMEVVWTRAFTPILETTIYAFAFLVTTYLFATWVGSFVYRWRISKERVFDLSTVLAWLAVSALLPVFLNDPRLSPTVYHVVGSLFPVCAILGYLTPMLIDSYSGGEPLKVGDAYGVNVLGCILGPLFAGYLLLPTLGVKISLIVLALPLIGMALLTTAQKSRFGLKNMAFSGGLVFLTIASLSFRTYEDRDPKSSDRVWRDHTATVISEGSGMYKKLLVNGIGITVLTPITKLMAHFPLAMLDHKPESALVICFGMGTTFRALTSWGIDTTAVELVPSVKKAFSYYHPDAEQVLARPNVRVVVDDGRRFLRRTTKKYDVITLDPPPPVEAAGSSLLYSVQFYDEIKKHLTPNGILQQWFPGGEAKILKSVAKSLAVSFPYVRVFHSIDDWGYHFLAADHPIQSPTADEMAARLPDLARVDMMEWYPGRAPAAIFNNIYSKEMFMPDLVSDPGIPPLTDDLAYNEYFLLRRHGHLIAPWADIAR